MAEDDINIDLKKFKKFFKKEKKEEPLKEKEEKPKEDIIEINTDKAIQVIKKYHLFLLIIIPIFLAVFFRSYTYELPVTDSWANQAIDNNIRAQIEQQINAEAPSLSQEAKNALANQRITEFKEQNKQQIELQTQQISEQFKANYKDPEGNVYLPDLDTYYYLRQAENVLDHGHIGDSLRDGEPWDDFTVAPIGRDVDPNLHPYVIASLYKVLDIFGNPRVEDAMFLLPVLLAALSTIPTFLIARKIGGNTAGLFAASLLAISAPFLGRTGAGFADTDIYNVFFPVTVLWLFIESMTAKTNKNKIIFGSLSGIALGLYAFTWPGWWYLLDLVIGAAGLYALYLIFLSRKNIKNVYKTIRAKSLIISFLSFFILTGITTLLTGNFEYFYRAPFLPGGITTIQIAAGANLWPNVYTTVAELNPSNFDSVVASLGGDLFLFLAVLGILLTIITHRKGIGVFYSIFLTFWFIGMVYASTKGIRFMFLAVPPFVIAFGSCLGIIHDKGSKWLAKALDINKKIIAVVILALLLLFFIQPLQAANATAYNQVPHLDDVWYNTLTNIRDTTAEDAIITSWWDFGHWFKSVGERRVTFDGTSQNRPQAHWIGKALQSDEDTALGIFRMVDCGGNLAFERIEEQNQDTLESVNIVNEIILQNKEQARTTLTNHGLTNVDSILEVSHCNPPEGYFIASEDMIGKAGVWSHFGGWDFEKSFIYSTVRNNLPQQSTLIVQEELGYTQEQAFNVVKEVNSYDEGQANQWISPFVGYSNQGSCSPSSNNTLICSNGALINTETNEVLFKDNSGNEFHPAAYSNGEETIYFEDSNVDFAVGYDPETNLIFFTQTSMIDGLFTKAFFFQGRGLENFQIHTHQTGLNGFDVYVYKINWK